MKNIFLLTTSAPSRVFYNDGKLCFRYSMSFKEGDIPQNIYVTSDEEIEEGDNFLYGRNLGKSRGYILNDSKKIILTTDPVLIKDGVQEIDNEFLEWFVNNTTCEEVEIFYGLFNAMGRQMNPMDLTQNHSQCVWKYKINIPKEKSISYEEFRAKASEGLLEQFDVDCLRYSEDKDSEKYFYEYCKYWENKLKEESKSSIITTRKPERAPNDIAISKDSPGVEPIPSKEYYFRGNKNETPEDAAAKYACGWGKDDDELSFLEGVKWQEGRSYNDNEVMSLLHKFMDSRIKDWHFYSTKKWFEQNKK